MGCFIFTLTCIAHLPNSNSCNSVMVHDMNTIKLNQKNIIPFMFLAKAIQMHSALILHGRIFAIELASPSILRCHMIVICVCPQSKPVTTLQTQVRSTLCEIFCKKMTDIGKYIQEEPWKKMAEHTHTQKKRKQKRSIKKQRRPVTRDTGHILISICSTFMKCCVVIAQERPFVVSLSIEFDASSFKTRVRKGMFTADAKYHVLETCLNQF